MTARDNGHDLRANRSGPAPVGLVGREAERAIATSLLQAAPLVSVIGPPGVGKTALLRSVVQPGPGVTWVDLSGLPPRAALSRIRQARGLHGGVAGEPLKALLHEQAGVLVLDGADRCLALCADLAARSAPGPGPARIVVTAQSHLAVVGEVTWTLGPLSVPATGASTLSGLESSESGSLLLQLLRQLSVSVSDMDAPLLGQACRNLGGMPLALKLFSATVATLGVGEACAILRPGRAALSSEDPEGIAVDRALRLATRSLNPREVEVLTCLAQFPVGLALEQIVLVAGANSSGAAEDLRGVLQDLAARSLITATSGRSGARYRVETAVTARLESIPGCREWCSQARQKRARWGLELVQGAEASLLTGPAQRAWLVRLEREEDNVRACLGEAIEAGDSSTAGGLAAELWRYWELRGMLDEGRTWLDQVLKMVEVGPGLRWRLLDGSAMLAWRQGDHESSRAALQEAMEIAQRTGSEGEARLLHHLGLVQAFANEADEATDTLLRAAEAHARAGELGQSAMVHSTLGLVLASRGDLPGAHLHLDLALGAGTIVRDSHAHAIAVLHLGLVTTLEGNLDQAAEHLAGAALELLDLGDERSAAYAALGLAAALRARDPRSALTLAEAAGAAVERLGTPVPEPWASQLAAAMADCWSDVGEAEAHRLLKEGRAKSLDAALAGVEPLLPRATECSLEQTVRTLGGFSVRAGGREVELVGQPATLVKLMASSPGALPVDAVMESVWPGVDPRVGRWRLRNVLSRLHRTVPGLTVRRGETLDFAPSVGVDSRRFSAACRDVVGRLRSADPSAARLGDQLLQEYRGEFLPGDVYDEWAIAARARLGAQRLQLLDQLSEWAVQHGERERAEEWMREAIDHDPWDERRHLRLAELLRASERQLAALEVLRNAAQVARSAGLSPSVTILERMEALRSP